MSDKAAGTPHHPGPLGDGGAELALFEGELARLESILAPGTPGETAQERADLRARDAEIVEILRARNFEGPLYLKVAGQLMEYAWPIMLGWTASGEIFRQARQALCPVPAHLILPHWTQDDRYEVVADSVLNGLDAFRNNALVGGRWSPDKGASLKTYYVRACIFAFRKVYEAWSLERAEAARTVRTGTGLEDDPAAAIPDQRAADPCYTAVIHDEIDRILPLLNDRQLRAAVAWRGAGCTQEEAADLTGMSVKAFEGRLARVRIKARAQHNDEGGAR
ncbi:hypothetical protein [Streptomyces sp. NPDC058644]|uniref:hypothetical protein n=1 Tax=unclassified Streptomyces TaxID=2593676 RepID=UPI00364D22EF